MKKSTASVPRALHYRGSDASMVGSSEPTWPDFEEQATWTPSHRRMRLGAALDWYHATQENKQATEFLAAWLDASEKRRPLAQMVRKMGISSITLGWLCRCNRMGLKLTIRDLKHIHHCLGNLVETQCQAIETAKKLAADAPAMPKVNIQDRINAKLRECAGAIAGSFEDFIQAGCTGEPNMMKILTDYNTPQVRVRDLVQHLEKNLTELNLVVAGTDPDLTEGYSNLGKREIKSMIWWLTKAKEQILSYGTMKAASRKPVAKRNTSPQKMVSKIKYMDQHEEFKIKSIDPVDILRATELWVYHVKTRKLGLYVVDDSQSALSVRGSRILGYSETRSVTKTLRNPAKQLKDFMAVGKPASRKMFGDLKTSEKPLNGRISAEMILLKAYK